MDKSLDAPLLRELFHYDPDTGVFTRKITRAKRPTASGSIGSADLHGYMTTRIAGKSYKLHRLAWLYMTGGWPIGDIDHLNGVRADNRFANLRDVPRGVNLQNCRQAATHNLSTKVLGVYPAKGGHFCAALSVNNKKRHLGTFDTIEQASAAYLSAKRQLHAGCLI